MYFGYCSFTFYCKLRSWLNNTHLNNCSEISTVEQKTPPPDCYNKRLMLPNYSMEKIPFTVSVNYQHSFFVLFTVFDAATL